MTVNFNLFNSEKAFDFIFANQSKKFYKPVNGWLYVKAYDIAGKPGYIISMEFRFSAGECKAAIPKFTWNSVPPEKEFIEVTIDADEIYIIKNFDMFSAWPVEPKEFCRKVKEFYKLS